LQSLVRSLEKAKTLYCSLHRKNYTESERKVPFVKHL